MDAKSQQTLEVIKVSKGKAERTQFATIPSSQWFDVSPSGNFLLRAEQGSGPVFLGNITQGKLAQKYSLKDTEGYRLVSWSPDENAFLLARNTLETDPEYRVVDTVSGSSVVLDTSVIPAKLRSAFRIRTFWTPNGKSLVFVNGDGHFGAFGSTDSQRLRLWRYDLYTYDEQISSLNPHRLTLQDTEPLLGTAFTTALSLWDRIQRESDGPLHFGYLPATSVSPSGRKAIVIGESIPRKDAPWAEAVAGYEAFLCDGKTVRRIRLSPSISGGFTWSHDERWVHTLTDIHWTWIRAERGSPVEESVSLGNMAQGTPHQTLLPGR